jgi:hypothetical protein
MATLKELSEIGEKLGFEGTDLHDYNNNLIKFFNYEQLWLQP